MLLFPPEALACVGWIRQWCYLLPSTPALCSLWRAVSNLLELTDIFANKFDCPPNLRLTLTAL